MGVILCDFGEIWGWRYWRDYPSFIVRLSFVIRSFGVGGGWEVVGREGDRGQEVRGVR